MKRSLIIMAAFTLASSLAWAQDGAALYKTKCAACHGAAGEGKVGPSLQKTALTQQQITDLLTKGAEGKKAPHSKAVSGLTADQAASHCHLRWDTQEVTPFIVIERRPEMGRLFLHQAASLPVTLPVEVTKVQLPTLYLRNLDKAQPRAMLELVAAVCDHRDMCPHPPQDAVNRSLTI